MMSAGAHFAPHGGIELDGCHAAAIFVRQLELVGAAHANPEIRVEVEDHSDVMRAVAADYIFDRKPAV
jgi:hypothetical protein